MTGRSSPDLNQAPLGGKTSVPMTMMDFYFNNIHFLRNHNVYMISKNMSRMPLWEIMHIYIVIFRIHKHVHVSNATNAKIGTLQGCGLTQQTLGFGRSRGRASRWFCPWQRAFLGFIFGFPMFHLFSWRIMTYCGWLRNRAPGRVTIGIPMKHGKSWDYNGISIYQLVQDFAGPSTGPHISVSW